MEEIVYYGVIAAMIVFGLYAGNRWARSMGQAVLLGLVGSALAVAAFLCLIVVLAVFSPTSGWAHCCSSDRRSGRCRRSAAGGAPRKPPGCFNGRNTVLPEGRLATLSSP